MNKQAYLSELADQLKTRNIEDIDEIVAEYEEHFIRKMADGYTEEEVAAKLGAPEENAAQFTVAGTKAERKKGGKILIGTGLVFADIFVVSFFIVLFSWAFVLGAASVSAAACGIGLLIQPLLLAGIILLPPMPYIGAIFLAATLLAFGILIFVLTIYSWALVVQLNKAYWRWHKNVMNDGKYPPYSMHPLVSDHKRRKLRNIGMIALIVFGASFIIGYIVLAASAGALGFWHAWNWFV